MGGLTKFLPDEGTPSPPGKKKPVHEYFTGCTKEWTKNNMEIFENGMTELVIQISSSIQI